MKKQQIVLPVVMAGIMLVPFLASADSFTETIENITQWIITVSLGLAALMYVAGGFLWMSDAGNAERAGTAKKIIVSTTIGLVVILMANGIISIVTNLVAK